MLICSRFKHKKQQRGKKKTTTGGRKKKSRRGSGKGNQTINREQKREASILGSANGAGTDLLDKDNGNFPYVVGDDASNIGVTINGNSSSRGFKKVIFKIYHNTKCLLINWQT